MKRIYLDYNATAPLVPEARDAMAPFLDAAFGNASSLHRAGQEARHAVESARETIARSIGADVGEIFFTSGGTEANNLALAGVILERKREERSLAVSAIEHPSVLDMARHLEKTESCRLTVIPAELSGKVDARAAAQADAALVSVMHANNETGAVQPVAEIAKGLKARSVLFHVDAVQSYGKLPFSVKEIGCDLASFSAHKLGGPKGTGALYIRKGVRLRAFFRGGGQEKNIRPGTENVAGIAAFAAAAEAALARREAESRRLAALKARLLEALKREPGRVSPNGGQDSLAGTLNVTFEGIDGQAIVRSLDLEGICVSTGSACTAGSTETSHVLAAMGLDPAAARGAVRISMGPATSEDDVNRLLEAASKVAARLRKSSVHAR